MANPGSGDKLAQGARSAQFPSCSHISQAKWDAMWEPEEIIPEAPKLPASKSEEKRLKTQKK